MIKFFRNIRKSLLIENKTSKYLKYAIGEIVLVVLGILIALQINNWNEERQLDSQFLSILKTVREDLKTDTIIANRVIRQYDTVKKYSDKVLSQEFNVKSLDSCPLCTRLVTIYSPMFIQKKGYNLLQNFTDYTIKTDSLATKISQFYSIYDELIISNMGLIKKEVVENLDYFKKQDWFINWVQGQKDPRVGEYFGNSLDYKNRVASHLILAALNYQRDIRNYNERAGQLIDEIDKRLNTD